MWYDKRRFSTGDQRRRNAQDETTTSQPRVHVCRGGLCRVRFSGGRPDGATPVYENDFATRTSAAPIPQEGWFGQPYYQGIWMNPTEAFTSMMSGQDSWRRTQGDNKSKARILDDNGNQYGVICYTETGDTGYMFGRHHLRNVFDSGIVELTVDAALPASDITFFGSNPTWLRIGLGDDDLFDRVEQNIYKLPAFYVGATQAGAGQPQSFIHRLHDDTYVYSINATPAVEAQSGYWYRYKVTVDVTGQTYQYEIFEMGTAHPAMDTPAGRKVYGSTAPLSYYNPNVKRFTTLTLQGYRPRGGEPLVTEPTHAFRFDNIVVRHGADAEHLEAYYLNDFTVRKYRRKKAGATTYTYSDNGKFEACVQTNNYAINTHLIAPWTGKDEPQPCGLDHWRRINCSGTGSLKTGYQYSNTKEFPVLYALTNSAEYVVAATPIGAKVTSGKVRVEVLASTPSGWSSTTPTGVYLTLAGDDYYNGVKGKADDYLAGRVAQMGFDRASGVVAAKYWNPGGGVRETTETAFAVNSWYKLVMEVDLDAAPKTYAYEIYYMGNNYRNYFDGMVTPVLMKSKSGIPICHDLPITTVALNAYRCSSKFDDLRVSVMPTGATEWTQIFDCTFDKRTVRKPANLLVGEWRNPDDGHDEWMRSSHQTADLVISGSANPAVGLLTYNSTAYWVNTVAPLGQRFDCGRLTAQVDMRPPERWARKDLALMCFDVGNDIFYQSATFTNSFCFTDFNGNRFTRFGIRGPSSAAQDYTDMRFYAEIGNGSGKRLDYAYPEEEATIDPSHWYRFVAELDVRRNKTDIKIYDMGTTQPTLATATPSEPVATISNLSAVMNAQAGAGLSAFGLLGYGASFNAMDSSGYDPAKNPEMPFFDNVRFTHSLSGFIFTVR